MVEFPAAPRGDEGFEIQLTGEFKRPREISIPQMVQDILLESYAPPCVIINEKGEIIYFQGRTGKYLEPAPGGARLGILEMAREGMKLELGSAMRRAISQKKDITIEGLRIKDDGGFQTVNVTVKPIREPEALRGLMMVVFEHVVALKEVKTSKRGQGPIKKADQRVGALERELQYTKEHLQTTIEELETSNEELKSANEELQSTNEELQSTNEELETTKEETQSLNEELVTVNSELQGKIDEISKANDDMRNFLDSTEVATIFLDNDLCLKGFTSHVSKVINLIKTDVGRPIGHIVSNLIHEGLVDDAKEVLKTLVFREKEVQTKDGHWYLMRVMPYRTLSSVIDGVVITFLDTHKAITAEKKLRESERVAQEAREYAESIVETVREPLVVLDADLRVISANRSFHQTFRVPPEETEGQFLYDLGNRQWRIPKLRELLEEILPKNTTFDDFEVEHDFPTIGHKKMLLNARRIFREAEAKEMILLAIEVGTERKEAIRKQ
jgi:two-component system CheB/CheR fusion protein